MNKEQIEEAINTILQRWDHEIPNYEYDVLVEELTESLIEYLESKREEIERKAYEEGVIEGKKRETSHYMSRFRLEINYDQWKELKKQEQ